MKKPTGDEPEREPMRKLTVLIPARLHRQVQLARLWAGQPQYALVIQALENLVEDYRIQRQAARAKQEESDGRPVE